VTYTNGLAGALDVVVNSTGWVYVANINAPQGVVSYPPKSTTASKTFLQLQGDAPHGLALDATGNVYVSYTGTAGAQVWKYPPHKARGINLGLNVGAPWGMTFDASGNLLVADQSSPEESRSPAVEVFPPGSTQPSQVITYSGFKGPYYLAFDKGGSTLFVSDPYNFTLDSFAYPAGTLEQTEPALISGVATWPSPPQ
jgi:DNA-binding beta-propeller fold protein YncE